MRGEVRERSLTLRDLRERAESVVNARVAQNAGEVDAQCGWPADSLQALAEAGLLGLHVPVRFGGLEQGMEGLVTVTETIAEGVPPAERRVIINTRSVHSDFAEVSVRDFGMGLPSDLPDKIFDHFFTTKQKGMGMGLTIVRSIVEAHGGTIVAVNAPDCGARMVIRLPAVHGETQKTAAT
jgi:signal transduction histidine kinase